MHRFGAEGDFAAGLREWPVAVAEVARMEEKPRAACPPRSREVAEVRERIRAVPAQILFLFKVRIGNQAEQQVVISGILPYTVAEFSDGVGIHLISPPLIPVLWLLL